MTLVDQAVAARHPRALSSMELVASTVVPTRATTQMKVTSAAKMAITVKVAILAPVKWGTAAPPGQRPQDAQALKAAFCRLTAIPATPTATPLPHTRHWQHRLTTSISVPLRPPARLMLPALVWHNLRIAPQAEAWKSGSQSLYWECLAWVCCCCKDGDRAFVLHLNNGC